MSFSSTSYSCHIGNRSNISFIVQHVKYVFIQMVEKVFEDSETTLSVTGCWHIKCLLMFVVSQLIYSSFELVYVGKVLLLLFKVSYRERKCFLVSVPKLRYHFSSRTEKISKSYPAKTFVYVKIKIQIDCTPLLQCVTLLYQRGDWV